VKKILLLQNGEGRKTQQPKIKQRVEESGHSYRCLDLKTSNFVQEIEEWISENGKPVATIRWDEHGNVFGRTKRFKAISAWGWENSVAPIAIDFAYFNHYGGFVLDLLDKAGEASIKREWDELDNTLIALEDFGGELGTYIKLIKRIYDKHYYLKSLNHTTPNFEIAAWTQCLVNNCRLLRTNEPDVWMDKLREIFGSTVLFKLQPSPFNNKEINLEKFRTMFSGGGIKIMNQSIEQNASVSVNARVNITNTSGVTSEFLVGKRPLITTGESWFTGLKAFYEPNSWEELEHMARNVVSEEIPDEQAHSRLKLANWWRNHQALHHEPTKILNRLINEFREKR
jgi:hypothetical protein